MAASIIDIAAAVVTELNQSGRFSQDLAAYRTYQPILELGELAALDAPDVPVVPLANPAQRADRGQWQRDYQCEIGFRKKLEDVTNATVDPLVALVEQMAEWFRANARPFATLKQYVVMAVEINPVFVPEHLDQLRTFTSVIALTFREWR